MNKKRILMFVLLFFQAFLSTSGKAEIFSANTVPRDEYELGKKYGFAGLVYVKGEGLVIQVAPLNTSSGVQTLDIAQLKILNRLLKDKIGNPIIATSQGIKKQDLSNGLQIVTVKYSLSQLSDWICLLSTPDSITKNMSIIFSAINPLKNRIDIGIDEKSRSMIDSLRTYLIKKGVPKEAVEIFISGPVSLSGGKSASRDHSAHQ